MNKKETKPILNKINEQWETDINLDDYTLLINDKGRVFIVNREVFDIDILSLNINSIGMYLCEIEKGIRLSIEGSQLIGPKAAKNVMEVSEDQVNQWLNGEDLETDEQFDGFVIIKYKKDFLGSGKYKDGKILNFVPKIRRLYN